MQEEQKELREEEIFWEKVKEKIKQWRVTIGIAGFILLVMFVVGIFALVNWMTGMVRAGGFSAEVDAAMIQAMVAIWVAVPATLLTGAGTILVTAHFNRQTQKIAIQSQRSTLRDKVLEKRLEIYKELMRRTRSIYVDLFLSNTISCKGFNESPFPDELSVGFKEVNEQFHGINDLYSKNEFYVSKDIRKLIDDFLETLTEIKRLILLEKTNESEFDSLVKKLRKINDKIYDAMNDELDLEVIDEDWKTLKAYRFGRNDFVFEEIATYEARETTDEDSPSEKEIQQLSKERD